MLLLSRPSGHDDRVVSRQDGAQATPVFDGTPEWVQSSGAGASSAGIVREDIAIRALHAGSVLTFSPQEVERHLQHAVEECKIMRSRGNIYFV